MSVIGRTTRLTATANTITLMEPNTKAIGLKISNTERELRSGPMVLAMKDHIKMERSTDLASSCGPTDQPMKVILLTITLMEKVYTPGLMVEDTKANGVITRCTAKVYLFGLTAVSTKETTMMIRKKVMVYLSGLMVAATTVNGRMASNTVKVFILTKKVMLDKANGLRASVSRVNLPNEIYHFFHSSQT